MGAPNFPFKKQIDSTPIPIESVLPQDVLLGRGGQHMHNPGNQRFYEAIDEALPLYDNATSKHEKSMAVLQVYRRVTAEGGRFVRQVKSSNKGNKKHMTYEVVPDRQAREKISHAVRYRSRQKQDWPIPTATAVSAAPATAVTAAAAPTAVQERRTVDARTIPSRTTTTIQSNSRSRHLANSEDEEHSATLATTGATDSTSSGRGRFRVTKHLLNHLSI